MALVCRLTDIDTGHDECPPTAVTSASSNVIIEGEGAARVGDSLASHGCVIHVTHGRSIVTGDTTVIVNGRKLAKVGSAISCGGTMASHAATVDAGGPLG